MSSTMIKLKKTLYTLIVVLFVTGFASVYAQSKPNRVIKKDSMEQDNARVVKEKAIRDTSKYNPSDTTRKKGKKNKGEKNMYTVPQVDKRKIRS